MGTGHWRDGPLWSNDARSYGLRCVLDGSRRGGQTVDPVVDVLFPPANRPGVFTAEANGWRERPIPFPTPDRGSAQPGDLKDFGQSHDPPRPRKLCHRAPMIGTPPDVVGLVSHSPSLLSLNRQRSCARPAALVLPSIGASPGACCCHRRYPRGFHNPVAYPPPSGRAQPRPVAHPPLSGRASTFERSGSAAIGQESADTSNSKTRQGRQSASPLLVANEQRHPCPLLPVMRCPPGFAFVATLSALNLYPDTRPRKVGCAQFEGVAVALNRDRSRIRSRILLTWGYAGIGAGQTHTADDRNSRRASVGRPRRAAAGHASRPPRPRLERVSQPPLEGLAAAEPRLAEAGSGGWTGSAGRVEPSTRGFTG